MRQRWTARRFGAGRRFAALTGLALLLAQPGLAETAPAPRPASLAASAPAESCIGRNLLADLPPADLAEMRARADAVPFSRGILWQATRGDARMVIAGTYHFGDPRHDATMAQLAPEIERSSTLLVEAGPEEEAQLLTAIGDDPGLLADLTGPTLPERLGEADWQRLSGALSERGIPAVVASKMRPWYVSTLLGMSPCMIRQAASGEPIRGLDNLLIAEASELEVDLRALEPWNTLFTVFAGMPPEDELDMIRASLPQAEAADDYATTMIEAYFAGDIWLLWEFTRQDAYRKSGLSREQVDEMMALTQRQLMDNRNRAWIAPLTRAAEEAATVDGQVIAGFGALHLPGEAGVLNLLAQDGWTVTALPGPDFGSVPGAPVPKAGDPPSGAPT